MQNLWANVEGKEESDVGTRRAFHAFTGTVNVAASAASAGAAVELGRCALCSPAVLCSCGYAKASELSSITQSGTMLNHAQPFT